MTTRCPSSDPQDPVFRVSNIRGQGPTSPSASRRTRAPSARADGCARRETLRWRSTAGATG
ncbi:hypothetical protein GEV49_32665 [Streptomyces sp. SYP-A7193]|nr:hypothetical protein GEV49_32665 [Streptomyces sp. SYP-A7193]